MRIRSKELHRAHKLKKEKHKVLLKEQAQAALNKK